jgi:phosphopantetheine adenylyltransferase
MRYLLITYLRKPNGQIDEQVAVGKKVKSTDIQMCNVIIDYAKKKVEKCVIEGNRVETDFEKMNEYYKRIYPSLVAQLEKEAEITAKEK